MPSSGRLTSYKSGTWINVIGALPPSGLSILITLSADKTPAGGTFKGYFDNVFLVHDEIFANGFEWEFRYSAQSQASATSPVSTGPSRARIGKSLSGRIV